MGDPRREAAAERAAQIRVLFDQGMTDAEIAAQIGTDRDTVRATRVRQGWLLPPDEVKRRRQAAVLATAATLKGRTGPGDGRVRPAPDVSHIYRGRRYDQGVVGDGGC